MKLIMIIFDADKEEDIHRILSDAGVEGFTTWGPVHGKGTHSDPRMGTQIWPGDNILLMAAVTEETAQRLRETLSASNETKTGVKVLALSAREWL